MQKNRMTKTYWESVWENIKLPKIITPQKKHELHSIFAKYLPDGNRSFVEVGCAPGSWMAYFKQNFNYDISGVEYAPAAYEKTKENLHLLKMDAKLYLEDFMEFKHQPYDIVFSSGFIEHFDDTGEVVRRLSDLCEKRGIIVTIIPNLCGINGEISKRFRPAVFKGHRRLQKKELISLHEDAGFKTVYTTCVGSYIFCPPIDKNIIAIKFPTLSKILNAPFKCWNRVVHCLTAYYKKYPKNQFFSQSYLYIGEKV